MIFIPGAGHGWRRAWSQFEIEVEGPPELEVEDWPVDPDEQAWLELEAHIERINQREAEIEAAADASVRHQEAEAARERRKTELRRADRRLRARPRPT